MDGDVDDDADDQRLADGGQGRQAEGSWRHRGKLKIRNIKKRSWRSMTVQITVNIKAKVKKLGR